MALQENSGDETARMPALWKRCAAAICLGLLGTHAAQAGPAGEPQLSGGLERHWTSNALDSDRNIADWYTLLRGTLRHQWGTDDANAGFSAQFQASRHDRISIEDDRALILSAQAFRRLGSGLELRGTLSYQVSSEGDDLDLGALVLGTRTLKQVMGAQAQLGIDLGNTTSLILEASDSFETIGATRFQDDLLPAAKLDPDKNRFQLAARLTRTIGRIAFGASASALLVSVERLGFPPVGLSLAQYTARAEAAFRGEDGSTLGLAFGAEFLRGAEGIYEDFKPTWQLAFTKPLGHGLELRGTWFGRYETADSDDPLASWLQRAELQAGMRLRENLAVASGIFCQVKQNLLFENEERSRGLYAEATYDMTPAAAIVFRVDFSETTKTVIDVHERTTDAFIGVRAKI